MKQKTFFFLILSLFLSLALAVPLVASYPSSSEGIFTATFLNMPYHGLSIVLQTPSGKVYLYDTGINKSNYNAGKDTILPWLKKKGISQIDGIIFSHSHGDHFGGAKYLMEHIKIKSIIDSGYEGMGAGKEYISLRKLIVEKGGIYQKVKAGDKLKLDEKLDIEVLSPPEKFLHQVSLNPSHTLPNLNSLVLRIQHGKNVFLLTGDINRTGQKHLTSTYKPEKLKATVMSAPHHGLDSYSFFAEATKPEIVVATCAKIYKGTHPGKRTEEAFRGVGSKVLVTNWHGTIEVASDGNVCAVWKEK